MDELDKIDLSRLPTATRPLLGLTVLVVEDSRYACEAMRLMCLRSGARLRRADCLKSARRHLQVYRPSVAIVDMGLPDGSGADLIAEMAGAMPRVDVILAISGDDFAETVAIAAGADGFLAKPLSGVSLFQSAVLAHLPAERRPAGLRTVSDEIIVPDPVAYRDDMAHAADVLSDACDDRSIAYVVQFLSGVARSAGDSTLLDAADALAISREKGQPVQSLAASLAGLVQERLSERVAI
ncbi:response regulator [Primorskyibacter flagellatus]|uniref:Response regulator receiver domain-containing protein n=1 Tax=Primorskyibacter flagellatus TaxID=1387277 RepID=A0A1W2AVJ4_9RHOB|nr:response regulator [Primorskyibacter flagellatus]SMC64703.1 Response regulator receiver domain-containing protein [Primorskyibacter flagellatus]